MLSIRQIRQSLAPPKFRSIRYAVISSFKRMICIRKLSDTQATYIDVSLCSESLKNRGLEFFKIKASAYVYAFIK